MKRGERFARAARSCIALRKRGFGECLSEHRSGAKPLSLLPSRQLHDRSLPTRTAPIHEAGAPSLRDRFRTIAVQTRLSRISSPLFFEQFTCSAFDGGRRTDA